MIYTSYFSKQAKEPVKENVAYASVAVGNPKFELPFELKHIPSVKPFGVVWKYEGEEYHKKYIERLERKGVDQIYEELKQAQGDKEDLILMCFEKNADECHRRMFAEWWLIKTGEIIEEL